MYVTINVMIAVTVNVKMKVTANVIPATDSELHVQLSDASLSVIYM